MHALTSLSLRNFQGHERLRIELDPHVTCIVGPTDSGKSSVIRALRWLITNRPAGDAFIKTGAEKTVVRLTVDGHDVVRVKGKNKNTYSIDGGKLKAFKSDVPEGVARLLCLSDINFQSQLDSPFWFSESAGEVSRQLNQIVNLGAIDSVISYLNSCTFETKATLRIVQERLVTAREEKKRLAPVQEQDKRLREVEALFQQAGRDRQNHAQAAELVVKATSCSSTLSETVSYCAAAEGVLALGDKFKRLSGRMADVLALVMEARGILPRAQQQVPSLAPMEELAARAERRKEKALALFLLVEKYYEIRTVLSDVTQAKETLEQELAAKIGSVCPLCNQPIK